MANDEIRDYSFDDNNHAKLNGKSVVEKPRTTAESASFIGKVFLTMFGGLLITTAVAVGLGFLFAYLYNGAIGTGKEESVLTGLIIAYVISAVGILVLSFVIPITFARGRHNILVPGIIYTILMGVIFTAIILFTDPLILAYSLGITTLIFGLMALIGFLGKGRMRGISIAIIGLLVGTGLLIITNLILMWIIPETFTVFYWVISFAYFAIILLITVWDMRNIKMLASRAEAHGNNVVLYCAYMIYVDFITILLRIIYYLALASGRK